MENFAIIGAAGFVAPRHLKAINETHNRLVAAVDPHDSVGILDRYFPGTKFFTEIERFDRFLEKTRRQSPGSSVRYISICSPNYLHDAHIRLALRVNADAICEKPLIINPWNLDALSEIEHETGQRVYTILQLRHHGSLIALKQRLDGLKKRQRVEVCLSYVTHRGPWYNVSWKGSEEKSGGIAMNIGVHFFDILLWLFGDCQRYEVHVRETDQMAGMLELKWADVRWFLSTRDEDVPESYRQRDQHAFRSLTMNGEEIEFSGGFTDLHTSVYASILDGKGLGIVDARPSIELVYAIRTCPLTMNKGYFHPTLLK